MRDPESTSLSSGCFLDALTSGQLGPTVWSSFVLPQHALSTPEVECRTAPRLLLALDYESPLVPRAAGLPMGSGVTAAGGKELITARFCRSEMHWKRESGTPILQLRAIKLSQHWDSF